MAFVEYLRVRRALLIYTIVIAACAFIVTASLNVGHVRANEGGLRGGKIDIPLTFLLATAGFGALVFGTLLSGSLNRERETLALSWTRPIPRERLGLAMMLVDLGGVVAAALIMLVLGSVPLVTTGLLRFVYADSQAPGAILLVLGVTVMWYGLVQAATSWYRGRAGLAVGLSWALFIGLIVLGKAVDFGPLVTGIAHALNYLNPLAYLSSYTDKGGELRATSYHELAANVRLAAVWCIGIAGCAIAIFAWKRSEA